MKNHILIIGAGQLGSRHLQALAMLDREVCISVLDPSSESLNVAKERWNAVASQEQKNWAVFYDQLEKVPNSHIDVTIIATNANIRLLVVQQLLQTKSVKYVILEKVVFQSIQHFEEAQRLFEEKNVQVLGELP